MNLANILVTDVRTALFRLIAVSLASAAWIFAGYLSLSAAAAALIPNPFSLIGGVFDLLAYPAMLKGGSSVFLVVRLVLQGMQLWAAASLVMSLLAEFAPQSVPGFARPDNDRELDGRRLARPAWVSLVFISLWVIGLVYLICWAFVALMEHRFRTVTLITTMDMLGYIPLMVAGALLLAVFGLAYRSVRASRRIIAQAFGANVLPADHALAQRVHGLARRLDMPLPAVAITGARNAFACGTSPSDAMVVIGVPLYRELTEAELDAVIGHELGHIVSGDMLRMQLAEAVQNTFTGATEAIGTVSSKSSGNANTRQMGGALTMVARHIVFLGGEIAAKGTSRAREFSADAIGAGLTSPDAMAGALRKISGMSAGISPAEQRYASLMFRGRSLSGVFATHPSFERRLEALDKETYLRALPRKS